MPISSAGKTSSGRGDARRQRCRGVTLIEMLVVMVVAGLIVGISFPSVSAGLDSLRLATTGDNIASFLNSAVNRVERRQRPVEVVISAAERTLSVYSTESNYVRHLKLPDGIVIEKVLPEDPGEAADAPRRLLLMPGSAIPAVGVQFANSHGGRRVVQLDPMTGFPRVESVGGK